MYFFYRFRKEFVLVILGSSVVGAIVDVLVGVDDWSIWAHGFAWVVGALVVPISYCGFRGVLGIQCRMHGPRPWIRIALALGFWFFMLPLLGSLMQIPVAVIAESHSFPLALPPVLFGSVCLAMLDTYSSTLMQSGRSESETTA